MLDSLNPKDRLFSSDKIMSEIVHTTEMLRQNIVELNYTSQYKELCKELQIGHRLEIGDLYVKTDFPEIIHKKGTDQYEPSYAHREIAWLPTCKDLDRLLEKAGVSSVTIVDKFSDEYFYTGSGVLNGKEISDGCAGYSPDEVKIKIYFLAKTGHAYASLSDQLRHAKG
jgi:hypothetical protein